MKNKVLEESLEETAVNLYQTTTLSMKAVGDSVGASASTVQFWLKKRKIKARAGYVPCDKERKEAAQMYVNGAPVSQIAKIMARSRTIIYKWLRQERVRN